MLSIIYTSIDNLPTQDEINTLRENVNIYINNVDLVYFQKGKITNPHHTKKDVEINEILKGYKTPNVSYEYPDDFAKIIKEIKGNKVFVIGEEENPYDVMHLCDYYEFDSPFSSLPLSEIVDNFDELQVPYNIYSGDKMREGNRFILEQIDEGREIIRQYLSAGYHERLVRDNVHSWCLNTETPFIKGCIHYYGLFPVLSDERIRDKIIESSIYRFQLLNIMIDVILNFKANNGKKIYDESNIYNPKNFS